MGGGRKEEEEEEEKMGFTVIIGNSRKKCAGNLN